MGRPAFAKAFDGNASIRIVIAANGRIVLIIPRLTTKSPGAQRSAVLPLLSVLFLFWRYSRLWSITPMIDEPMFQNAAVKAPLEIWQLFRTHCKIVFMYLKFLDAHTFCYIWISELSPVQPSLFDLAIDSCAY
jgi:hypothetical protein